MKVKTIAAHSYAGVKRYVGDVYDADNRFINILLGLGRVKVFSEDEPKAGTYKRRDMRAEK